MSWANNQNCTDTLQDNALRTTGSFKRYVLRIPRLALDTLLMWQERAFQRRALEQLDARMLKDIGLSSADVQNEVRKPFWRD